MIPAPTNGFRKTSLVVVAMFLLSACAETMAGLAKPPPPKELSVHAAQFSHQVRFARAETQLLQTERDRIDGFIARLGAGGGDAVYLAASGDNPVDRRRRDIVGAYLRSLGLSVTTPDSDFGIPEPADRSVRIVVRRHVVRLPGCPDWTKNPSSNFGNTVHSNFGCATATNFGLMVSDPAHIARGQQAGPMDGEYIAGSIDRYRRGETKPLDDGGESATSEPQQTTNISIGGGS